MASLERPLDPQQEHESALSGVARDLLLEPCRNEVRRRIDPLGHLLHVVEVTTVKHRFSQSRSELHDDVPQVRAGPSSCVSVSCGRVVIPVLPERRRHRALPGNSSTKLLHPVRRESRPQHDIEATRRPKHRRQVGLHGVLLRQADEGDLLRGRQTRVSVPEGLARAEDRQGLDRPRVEHDGHVRRPVVVPGEGARRERSVLQHLRGLGVRHQVLREQLVGPPRSLRQRHVPLLLHDDVPGRGVLLVQNEREEPATYPPRYPIDSQGLRHSTVIHRDPLLAPMCGPQEKISRAIF